MAEYIERDLTVQKILEVGIDNYQDKYPNIGMVHAANIVKYMPAADVAPVVHGVPVLRNRPSRHERFEEAKLEDGEILYRKYVYVDETDWVEYCPVCGKRLCSRFNNFCPNCGAKMEE